MQLMGTVSWGWIAEQLKQQGVTWPSRALRHYEHSADGIRLLEWRWKAYQLATTTDLGKRYEHCAMSVAIPVGYAPPQSCLLSIYCLCQSITRASAEGSTTWLYPTLLFSNLTFTCQATNARAGRFKDGRIYWQDVPSFIEEDLNRQSLPVASWEWHKTKITLITSLLSEMKVGAFDPSDYREPWSSSSPLARVLEKLGPILGTVRWNITFLNVFSVSSCFPPQITGNLLLLSILRSDFHWLHSYPFSSQRKFLNRLSGTIRYDVKNWSNTLKNGAQSFFKLYSKYCQSFWIVSKKILS